MIGVYVSKMSVVSRVYSCVAVYQPMTDDAIFAVHAWVDVVGVTSQRAGWRDVTWSRLKMEYITCEAELYLRDSFRQTLWRHRRTKTRSFFCLISTLRSSESFSTLFFIPV